MPYAIQFDQPGTADALCWREVPAETPGKGEVLVRQSAIGINYIDIYHRSGLYPLPSYPAIPGLEAAGEVVACGEGVTHFSPGDRVAYARGAVGAYREMRVVPEALLVPLPESIDDITAAAIMLKGLTAHYLLRRTFPVREGHTVLIHAAAGGVGLLFCQWARHLGARVIGTVGNEEKAALARANGCDEAIVYAHEDVAQRVRVLTSGEGVDAVYDSVGQATFMASLDCLKRFGTLVSFGQSSGPVPPFDIALLQQKGSLYLTRPTLLHHTEDKDAYRAAAAELFSMLAQGHLKPRIDRIMSLKEAAEAHRLLEGRKTSGAVVLKV